jgi:hypothetical protein
MAVIFASFKLLVLENSGMICAVKMKVGLAPQRLFSLQIFPLRIM